MLMQLIGCHTLPCAILGVICTPNYLSLLLMKLSPNCTRKCVITILIALESMLTNIMSEGRRRSLNNILDSTTVFHFWDVNLKDQLKWFKNK